MKICDKGFRPILLPPYQGPKPARRPCQTNLFRVQENFKSKTAANIRCAHPHFVQRHRQGRGNLLGDANRPLCAAPNVQTIRRITGASQHRPGLKRIDHHTTIHHVNINALPAILCGRGKCRVGGRMITSMPVKNNIILVTIIELRRIICHCRIDIRHRRHRVKRCLNQFNGIIGLGLRIGNNHSHNIASVAIDIAHHRRLCCHWHFAAIKIFNLKLAMNVANLIRIKICLTCHQPNPGGRYSRAIIKILQSGMGIRRPQKSHPQPSTGGHIISVTTGTGDKAFILYPRD